MSQLSLIQQMPPSFVQDPAICELIAAADPLGSTKALTRVLSKSFPTKLWHIKKTGAEWYSASIAVINPDGSPIAPDATTWLAEQEIPAQN
jgi:hypothetical protein